jgi:PAS domain S-box-containing protein
MEPPSHKQGEEFIYLLASAVQHIEEAVVITTKELDLPGPEIVYVNKEFCRMTGYATEEIIGKTPRILQGPKTDRAELDRVRRCLSQGEAFKGGEIVNYRKDSSEYIVEWHLVPLYNDAGKLTHWMASERDITERKALEGQLRYQAFHDPLTKLPNRALFMDRLEHALSLANRRQKLDAVLLLDLDNFKVVNDSLGHEAGDSLLIAVAERLRVHLRAVGWR